MTTPNNHNRAPDPGQPSARDQQLESQRINQQALSDTFRRRAQDDLERFYRTPEGAAELARLQAEAYDAQVAQDRANWEAGQRLEAERQAAQERLRLANEESAVREHLRALYMETPCATVAGFESAYPHLREQYLSDLAIGRRSDYPTPAPVSDPRLLALEKSYRPY